MGALRPGTDRLHFLSTLHRHFRFRLPLFGPPVLQKDDGGRTRAVQVRVLLLRVLECEYTSTRVLLEYSGVLGVLTGRLQPRDECGKTVRLEKKHRLLAQQSGVHGMCV